MISVKALHLLGNTLQYRTTNQHTNKTMNLKLRSCDNVPAAYAATWTELHIIHSLPMSVTLPDQQLRSLALDTYQAIRMLT